jgi:hypothetical protein
LELLSRLILILALMLPACLKAQACQYPPPPTFREALHAASNVFVFQLVEARYIKQPFGRVAYTDWVEGKIRPLQTLKGDANQYARIRFPTSWCGAVNLVVGHYYLIATHDTGPTMELVRADGSIIDVEGFYDPQEKRRNLRSLPIAPVIRHLYTQTPLDPSFPGPLLAGRTVLQSPPPLEKRFCDKPSPRTKSQ